MKYADMKKRRERDLPVNAQHKPAPLHRKNEEKTRWKKPKKSKERKEDH